MRHKIAAALIASALPLTLAGPASADGALIVGLTGAPLTGSSFLGSGIQAAIPSDAMPADGTVTSFQFESGTCADSPRDLGPGIFDFQVLRPGPNGYTVIGHTGNQTDPCDSAPHTYPVNIPVRQGDILGANVSNAWYGVLEYPDTGSEIEYYYGWVSPAVGDTLTMTDTTSVRVDEAVTFTPLGFQSLIAASRGTGPGTSLVDKATKAQAFYNAGDTAHACGILNAYINQVTALKSRISNASNLIQAVHDVQGQVGCSN